MKGGSTAVIKIIEAIGTSEKSWEDAVAHAVSEASKTIRNITGVDVLGFKAEIKDGKIKTYKANIKIAFVVER